VADVLRLPRAREVLERSPASYLLEMAELWGHAVHLELPAAQIFFARLLSSTQRDWCRMALDLTERAGPKRRQEGGTRDEQRLLLREATGAPVPYDQIAKASGIGVASVKSSARRARKKRGDRERAECQAEAAIAAWKTRRPS
jgi:hypothetical protein